MNGFDAYQLYLSIKFHFSQESYDYFKYQGRVKVNADKFETRKDKWFFERLARDWKPDTLLKYYVSNLFLDEKTWVTDLSEEVYYDFVRRNEALDQTFINDVQHLFSKVDTPAEIFHVDNGQHSVIMREFISEKVSPETLILLNQIVPFFDQEVNDTVLWPKWAFKMKKLTKFLTYDIRKIKEILIAQLKDYS